MFDHAYSAYRRKRGAQVPESVQAIVIGALLGASFLLLWGAQ